MADTQAKLRELVGAASPGPWEYADVTATTQNAEIRLASDMDAKLAAAAPALARLVVQLSEALDMLHKYREGASDKERKQCRACAALDAVEALEL